MGKVNVVVIALSLTCHASLSPCAAAAATPATGNQATAPRGWSSAERRHIERLQRRHPTLATRENVESLVHGLRTASRITLTHRDGRPPVSFTPPTPPMDYRDIGRVMTFAKRQLAAVGVTVPTPEHVHRALMGGALRGAKGVAHVPGVLQLRSRGVPWEAIAQPYPPASPAASQHRPHAARAVQ